MITAYAFLKKAAANANHVGKRLDDRAHALIVQVCDEILSGRHAEMFPLHVWMTGSGTQFNMNVNVISNRCCQLAGTPLGSKHPVHPNDHVNMSQSSNDSFPSAMCIAAAVNTTGRLIPAVKALRDAIAVKANEWDHIVKIGRTHMQDKGCKSIEGDQQVMRIARFDRNARGIQGISGQHPSARETRNAPTSFCCGSTASASRLLRSA